MQFKVQSKLDGPRVAARAVVVNVGIDDEGADQLRRTICNLPRFSWLTEVNTRKWIGTTEIYTLMTSAGFRYSPFDVVFLTLADV